MPGCDVRITRSPRHVPARTRRRDRRAPRRELAVRDSRAPGAHGQHRAAPARRMRRAGAGSRACGCDELPVVGAAHAMSTSPHVAAQDSINAQTPWLEITASRHFAGWMASEGLSLAFTTYQTGKLFFIGRKPDNSLSVFERTFNRCMGLWGDGQTLWMSSLYQIWRFENALARGELYD